MALRSAGLCCPPPSLLLWPSPTPASTSPQHWALRLAPQLTVKTVPTGRAGPPQLLEETFFTCRRLLHRRFVECSFPFSSSTITGFAHRTEARQSELYPTLPAILVGLPLRCLRSFVFLRPAILPRHHDWLLVHLLLASGSRPAISSLAVSNQCLRCRPCSDMGDRFSILMTLSLRIGFTRQSGCLSEMGN